METNNDNKCPDHPDRDNKYCFECIKRIEADTSNQIFAKLDSFIEPMKIYEEDGTSIEMPTMNLVKYLEYQGALKKQYKVD
jgi:hypothetical protein